MLLYLLLIFPFSVGGLCWASTLYYPKLGLKGFGGVVVIVIS